MIVLQQASHTQAEAAKQPRLSAFFGPTISAAQVSHPQAGTLAIPEAAAQAGEAGRALLLELALLSVPVDDHR